MYWSPNFLAVVFFKARNFTASSHQNAGFSIRIFKNFPTVIPPDPHSGRERPPPAPNTQPGVWPGAGRKRPDVGTQTLVPRQLLIRGCAPAAGRRPCGLLTMERAWLGDHATSSMTAVLPPSGQRCGTVCLNSFGNRTSPSDNSNDR